MTSAASEKQIVEMKIHAMTVECARIMQAKKWWVPVVESRTSGAEPIFY